MGANIPKVEAYIPEILVERVFVELRSKGCNPMLKIAYFRGNCACGEIRSQFGYIRSSKRGHSVS